MRRYAAAATDGSIARWLRHIAKRHLRFFILWYTREDARDDFLGMGPDRIVMRIVVAPDEIVHADKMARQHADGVVFKGGVELALKIRAGFHGEVRRGLAARPVGGMVEGCRTCRASRFQIQHRQI